MTATTPGTWIAASKTLGRPVPTSEPYPHICGLTVTDTTSGRPTTLGRRDCAACANRPPLRLVRRNQ